MMENGFPLAQLFTAQGALVGAAAVTLVVQLIKRFVPALTGGRVLWVVAGLSAGLTVLAALDAGEAWTPQFILNVVMTWAAVATAAVGAFEAGAATMHAATSSGE